MASTSDADGQEDREITEGLASILVPKDAKEVVDHAAPTEGANGAPAVPQTVFYNPIQQFNRDLTILAIKAFGEEAIAVKRSRMDDNLRKGRNNKKRKLKDREETDAAAEPSTTQATPESSTPHFRILDALSATGLRALRYAKEIPFVTSITANDLLPAATKAIELNIRHNKVEDKVHVVTGNALAHMYSVATSSSRQPSTRKYDVVDLDPYGTAAPFFDAAVQSLTDGGLLCATCTDPGVFASTGYPEKCYALYGGSPMKGPHSHEGGLRLILHAIATSAARYGLTIEPLLSLSIDYYARVFVRIRRSPAALKFLGGKTMIVYSCDSGCGALTTQPLVRNKEFQDKKGNPAWKHGLAQGPSVSENCHHCGFKTHLAGPMYGGPLHSPPFIQRILAALPDTDPAIYGTKARIEGMLITALEEDLSLQPLHPESSDDRTADSPTQQPATSIPDTSSGSATDPHPFFIVPQVLAKVLHCATPTENALRGALLHLGYRTSRSHCKAGSIKTDAPWDVIWAVMRAWVRERAPIKDGAVREGTPGWKIISQIDPEDGREIRFDEKLGAQSRGGRGKVLRYQINPANWGPMQRAKGEMKMKDKPEKGG